MTRFAEPVLAFAADDRHFDIALRFLALLRETWPDQPVLLIPRAGPGERLAAFAAAYRFSILARDFGDLDLLAEICLDTRPERDRLRRLAVFDMDAPSVLCVDPAMRLLTDPAKMLARLAAASAPTVEMAGDESGFALGGPPLGVARLAKALRENLVAYMSDRQSDGIEMPVLQSSLAALGLTRDAAPDWPDFAPLGPQVGAAVPVAGLREMAADLAELDNGGRYRRGPASVIGAPGHLAAAHARQAASAWVEAPPALLARLCSVSVLDRGLIVTAAGALVRESLINTEGSERFGPFSRDAGGTIILRAAAAQPVRFGVGPYILLKQTWDHNYGHWLVESLPRLGLVAERLSLADCHVVIGSDDGAIGAVYRDTLALLGIAPDRILALPDEAAFFAELIYPAPLTVQPYVKAPRVIRFLEELGARVPEGLRGPARLYVSRNRQPRRCLRNEAAVFRILSARGYVFAQPEALGFAEQVRLFRHATHIIGNLGAALTNLVFAPRGVRLLALTSEFMQDDFFWDLVSQKGGSYTSLHGTAADPHDGMQSDFSIDVAELERHLAAFEAPGPEA